MEDATQLVLAEALRSLTCGSYDPQRASFITFVYGVARRIWLRFIHESKHSRSATLEMQLQNTDTEDWPSSIDEEVMLLEQIEQMRGCLSAENSPWSLTTEERFVVIGRARGETFESLAKILNCSLDTVFRRNAAAITKLRRCFMRR